MIFQMAALRFQSSYLKLFFSVSPRSLHEAIVKKLRMMDIAGATVYRGVKGYGAQQRLHKPGWLGLSTDLPIMISIIDTEEKIKDVVPMLDEMVDEGLVVLSDVEIIKYTHKSEDVGK